jgi:RNA polymerase sigma-70 factor, ECF subfamily
VNRLADAAVAISMAIAQRPDAAEATRKLFDDHSHAVLTICRVILRDADEAEDAAQQTFLSVHRSLLSGTVPRNSGAWIAAIARNECRARLRRNGSSPLPLNGEAVDGADETNDRSDVSESLAELPRRQREAVVLRDVFGLSHMEIATALGVDVGAVNPLLTRARGRLRNRLRGVSRGVSVVVPAALRDQLAQLIPGFEASAAPASGAGALGLAAKLASAPAAAKVAALVGVAAVGATAPQLTHHPQHATQGAALAEARAHVAPRPVQAERPAAERHRRGRDHGTPQRVVGRTDDTSHEGSGRDDSGGGRSGPETAVAPTPAPDPAHDGGSGKTPPTATEPERSGGGGGGPGPSSTTAADGGTSNRGPGGGGTATTTVVETNAGPGGGGVETVDGGGTDTHAGTDDGRGSGSGSGKDGSGG